MTKKIFALIVVILTSTNALATPSRRFTLPAELAAAFRNCFTDHYDYLTANGVLRSGSDICVQYDICTTPLERDYGINETLLDKLAFALAFQQGKATRSTSDPRRYGDEYGRESSTIRLNECVDLQALKREVVTEVLDLELSVLTPLNDSEEGEEVDVVPAPRRRGAVAPAANARSNCP